MTAVDLAARPDGVPERVEWLAGDVFSRMDDLRGGVLVANLFVHHFDQDMLGRFGQWARNFPVICLCEP